MVFTTRAFAVVAALFVGVAVDESLKEGEEVAPFEVFDVTGPAKDTEICYRCKFKDQPVVCIFTRDMTENTQKLIKKLDQESAAKKVNGFVCHCTDEVDPAKTKLAEVAKTHELKIPLTVFKGVEGPKEYKLAKDSEVTVMCWTKGKLVCSNVVKASELDDARITDLAKNLDKIVAPATSNLGN
jgi:hypothetical protein